VIPETYTEIAPYAFMNCESLETVICYAPIEKLDDCTFRNCTSLREVVFVNGVHSIGEYVFDNCPNLQTVYLGQYAENISEYAFLDQFGEPLWSLESCITDPAMLPDVDAMLAAVKCEPMAEPEFEDNYESDYNLEFESAPAVPVGEEGSAFFGMWIGTEMDMGGELMPLSDWDMSMILVLLEDGHAIMSEEEITAVSAEDLAYAPAWHVENGVAISAGYTMTILDDGRLLLDEDGFLVYFERSDATIELPDVSEVPAAQDEPEAAEEPAAQEEPAQPAADAAAGSAQHTGVKFVCESADVSGYNMDASMLGGEYSMIFNDDGNAIFVVVGSEMPGVTWTTLDNGNFQIDFYGTPIEIVWTDAGFDMNYMDSMLMHFVPEN